MLIAQTLQPGTPVQRVAAARGRFPHALAPLHVRGVSFANRLFFAPMGVDLAGHDGRMSSALPNFWMGW
jgi:hypothetical protein